MPEVKLEKLCADRKFKLDNNEVEFGLTDFGKHRQSGFFIKNGDNVKAINLHNAGIAHDFYMDKNCFSTLNCIQVHQNEKNPKEFGLILGAMSGCCDGAALGGIYTLGEEDSFELLLARRVPFNTFGVIGAVSFHEEGHDSKSISMFALGAGCNGAGVQYLRAYERNCVEQEWIYNLNRLKDVAKIKYPGEVRYEDFHCRDSLEIKNGVLTAAYKVDIEDAHRVANEYYEAKALPENKGDNIVKSIDDKITRIRYAASQSLFINRNQWSVYP